MKKFLITVCSVVLLGACGHKVAGGNVSGASSAAIEELENKVGNRVFFAFDRSDVSETGKQVLDQQAAFMKRNAGFKFVIEGHCDKRGTREYNLALGERRAESVKSYLISQGVDSSKLDVISYGKEKPAVLGDDEAAFKQNRRAVTVIQ